MKNIRILLFVALTTLCAQLSLAQQKRDMPVANFNKLTLQGNLQVELTQGDKAQVYIFGTEEEINEVTLSTSGDKLSLKTKLSDQLFEKENRRGKRIKVQITYTNLSQLTASRGAEVKSRSVLSSDDLEVKAHSGSMLNLEVLATNLRLEVSEGAQATIAGKATVQKTTVSTGAELIADRLESEIVNIRTNTGANARVSASKSLDASAGTGGNIRYRGRPSKQDINTSLGGSISQL